VSQKLKSLEAAESGIADVIDLLAQMLASAADDIERAHQMIAKVNIILAKIEPVHHAKTAKLTLMTARSIQAQKLEAEKRSELEKI